MKIANRSKPSAVFGAAAAAAVAAAVFLGGCLVKDRSEKPLHGELTPPWYPAHFSPQRLDGFTYAGPESLFTVFRDMSRLDSLSGDPKDWKADPEAVDTLRIEQMLDMGFVFPENPEAMMPYGYDDSFRDDTVYRNAYGNGLFTQDQPCADTYVLSGNFLHPAKWLRAGLKQEYILATLGKPAFRHESVLRYLHHTPAAVPPEAALTDTVQTPALAPAPDADAAMEVFEGVNFYFDQDSLFATVLQKSRPCH